MATRTVRGGSAFGIYPLDRFRRIEFSGGFVNLQEQYNDPFLQDSAQQYQQQQFGQQVFRNGTMVPLSAAFVQETTVFREFGPLAGSTMRFAYDVAPKIAGTLSRQTFDGDARYYQRLASTGVLAMRLRGFKSIGDSPDFLYFGGNSEMRGYDYLQFVGQNVAFANAELRFPIIEAALTPIGVIGGVRGVFFANIGGGWFNNQPFKFATSNEQKFNPIIDYQRDATGAILFDAVNRRRVSDLWAGKDHQRLPPRRTAARPTAWDSKPSLSVSRSTSTGRGARCSTAAGRMKFSRPKAPMPGRPAASGSASHASRSGLATTSRGLRLTA